MSRLVATPHPFETDHIDCLFPDGSTVAEIVAATITDPVYAAHAHIYIGDQYIPRHLWHRVRPKHGATLYLKVVAHGGGGGGGKNPLRTVLTIAVIAASFYFGPQLGAFLSPTGAAGASFFGSLTYGQLGGAIIGVAGYLATNAIAPVRPPSLANLSQTQTTRDSPTLFIEGARNGARPFSTVPVVLGVHKNVPPLGVQTYTEVVGDDNYLRMLVVWGYGPLKIENIKIGETPIEDFDDVTIETREGRAGDAAITIIPDQVAQDDFSILLAQASDWQTRSAQPDADELSVDLTFPSGLVQFNDQGGRGSRSVAVQIQYRLAAGGSPNPWLTPTFTANTGGSVAGDTVTFTANRTSAIRHGLRWSVGTRGDYEIRIRRTTSDTDDTQIFDQVSWTALRAITDEDPINFAHPLAVTALSIKATDQLNRAVDELSATTSSYVERVTDDTEVVSSNPADLYRHVLQGVANVKALSDARVDIDKLHDWYTFCVTNGFEFNMIRDFQASVWDTLADIAAAGRASPAMIDGKWSVVVDEEQTVPVQHFTPRNSWGFEAEKNFPDQPHAFRIRFSNRDKDWRQDERIVYADGYTAANATDFEGLDAPGVTDPDHIWKFGRFQIAQAELRPERWTFNTDFEFLVARRGDLVVITHDVLLVGLASGRIKGVTTTGDARLWTERTAPDATWVGLTWSPDLALFVAVGTNAVMTSPDGINWTSRTQPGGWWQGVTWSPDLTLFAAVGSVGGVFTNGAVMTSPDGINWTARTGAGTSRLFNVAWSPDLALFVAVGDIAGVMTSPDGINWTARTGISGNWRDITWSPDLTLFVTVGTNQVMTSPDGINWTARTSPSVIWLGVTWSSDLTLFVAVGVGGAVMTSPDGINWTARTGAGIPNWSSVIWSPDIALFVAVGNDAVMTSPDGINWTARTAITTPNWSSVTWSPALSLFTAIGGDSALVMTSSPFADIGSITVDETLTMEANTTYGVSIRTVDDAEVTRTLVTDAGDQTTVTFTVGLPENTISVGDLFGFGVLGSETIEGLILSIEPNTELSARITCIPASPAVYDADTGTIPAFDSKLTALPTVPVANITNIRSDESVLQLGSGDTLIPHIGLSVERPDTSLNVSLDVQLRATGTGEGFYNADLVSVQGSDYLIGNVEQTKTYDLRVRWRDPTRLPGPWTYIYGHRVVGQANPPSGLTGATISVFGGNALIRWERLNDLDVRFGGEVRFRHSPETDPALALWASSTSIGTAAKGDALFATLPLKPGTYLARVFDRQNRPSATVVVLATKQASVLTYANVDTVTESPTFTGVKTNVAVDGSSLKLAGLGSFDDIPDFDAIADLDSYGGIASSGTYMFAGGFDLTTVQRVRLTSTIEATSVNTLDRIDERTAFIDSWEDFDGTTQSAADCRVQVRHTDGDPAGSPVAWSVWNDLDSAEFEARGFEFRAQLTTDDPAFNIRVDTLSVVAENI